MFTVKKFKLIVSNCDFSQGASEIRWSRRSSPQEWRRQSQPQPSCRPTPQSYAPALQPTQSSSQQGSNRQSGETASHHFWQRWLHQPPRQKGLRRQPLTAIFPQHHSARKLRRSQSPGSWSSRWGECYTWWDFERDKYCGQTHLKILLINCSVSHRFSKVEGGTLELRGTLPKITQKNVNLISWM